MSKPKLTDQEKLIKRIRDNLLMLHNRVKGAHSFGQIKTWGDVYKACGQMGVHENDKTAVTFPELKSFLDDQTKQQEKTIQEKYYDTRTDDREMPQVKMGREVGGTISIQHGRDNQSSNVAAKVIELEVLKPNANIPARLKNVSPEPIVQTETVKDVLKPVEYTAENDYGFVPSPKMGKDAFLYWFQKKAAKELIDNIVIHKKRGQLLLSSTGTGKTFMTGALIRHLVDLNFHENKTWSHIPYLTITRATVVTKTERDYKKAFNLTAEDSEVINIEQLRSKAGRLWVTEGVTVLQGEEYSTWTWKEKINPVVILLDECQAVKNSTSTQHKIMSSFNDLKTRHTHQVFISATPFTRVSEAKCFAVSTHHNIEHLGFPPGTILTNETWPAYASAIASPSAPDEYNEAAVERLMKDLDQYVVRVKGVRPQFDAVNGIEMIDFETPEEKKYYDDTERRYMEKKAKMESMIMSGALSGSGIWPLVLLNERCMAAELCRKNHLAKKLYHAIQEGYAGVCALKYKATMIAVVKILVEKYGVPRDSISLVWGGGQTALTDKQKAKANIKAKALVLESMGMDVEEMLKDLDLDEVEDRIIEELDPSLRLGAQSADERQSEIDRFQSGKSIICLYTFKAGGVGLSLHHSDELTKDWDRKVDGFEEWEKMIMSLPEKQRPAPGKCRHKESGYAYEEDIPFIPVRQRRGFVAPTYSAIELVQGLGRAPRLTSLSPTHQTLLFYRGTVEMDVAAIVSVKLRCLAKVVRQRESWQQIISDHEHRQEFKEDMIKSSQDSNNDNEDLLGDEDNENS